MSFSSARMSSSSSMYHNHHQSQHQDYRGPRGVHHHQATQSGTRSSFSSSSSATTHHNNNMFHHSNSHHGSSYHHHQQSSSQRNHQSSTASLLLQKQSHQQQQHQYQQQQLSYPSKSNIKNDSNFVIMPNLSLISSGQPTGDEDWLRTSNSPEPEKEEPDRLSLGERNWFFGQDHYNSRTPARLCGISVDEERRRSKVGCDLIRDMAKYLKIKSICKETAYVYFHRYFMVRPLTSFDMAMRIGTAAIYLAGKFEEYPIFKDSIVKLYHMIKCNYYQVPSTRLHKDDKEYNELCDRLLLDENRMLRVLGFEKLQVKHFQVLVVEACQKRPENIPDELYKYAYQIASEMNRLTPLCVLYLPATLACVAIYLAATYRTFSLPNDWYRSLMPDASIKEEACVAQIAEYYREVIAVSPLVRKLMTEHYRKKFEPRGIPEGRCPPVYTPRHQSSSTKQIQQQMRSSHFSPDSAYSSGSSTYSPNEHSFSQPANAPPIVYDMIQPNGRTSSYQSQQEQLHHKQEMHQQQVKRGVDDDIPKHLSKRPRILQPQEQQLMMAPMVRGNAKMYTRQPF